MSSPAFEAPTLADFLTRLPGVLTLAAAPRGIDGAVSDLVILDLSDPAPAESGALVLGVGVESPRTLAAWLDRLGDNRPAGIVVKGLQSGLGTAAESGSEDLSEAPGRRDSSVNAMVSTAIGASGVAVLRSPQEITWGRLHALLLTALAARPTTSTREGDPPLGDLFALANAVAAMVGGATTIEDPHSVVLAYSSLDHPIDEARRVTILGRQIPKEWHERLIDSGAMRRLWQTDAVVRIDFPDQGGYRSRLAIAIRVGGELLGSIWAIEPDGGFDDLAERRLTEAASIAALHLLHYRRGQGGERQRRADALLDLLEGKVSSDGARSLLGVDPLQPAAVVGFDVAADGDPTAAEAIGERLAERVADLVAVHCEAYRRSAVCATRGARVYALIPISGEPGSDSLRALAATIAERAAETLHVDMVVGLGPAATGYAGLPSSRRDVDRVIEVLRREANDGKPRIADIGQVRAKTVLRRLTEISRAHPELREGRLEALRRQDEMKSTSWVPTLRAYFDFFGDLPGTAAAVNVHPNTFRYRLRRIEDVFGIDLSDPDERLVAELQLRFLADDTAGL